MQSVSVQTLIESGVHFGHKASRWNPKMKPYIYGKRNLIHIIDLKQTIRGIVRARHFLQNIAAEGGTVLFVATKRQAQDVVREAALSCDMPYATERWLGGMLTNYTTVRSRLRKLDELESMVATGEIEQYSKKMIATITRNIRKLRRNLGGVRHMDRQPNAVVIIDPRREKIALAEANKLGIPTVCILDTDCDPDHVDIPIPANDDAMRSVKVLCEQMAQAVATGKKEYDQRIELERKKAEEKAAAEQEKERARKEIETKKKADEAAVRKAMEAREAGKPAATPAPAAVKAPVKPKPEKPAKVETAPTKSAAKGAEVKAKIDAPAPGDKDVKAETKEAGTT